jgi:hypothetical protein
MARQRHYSPQLGRFLVCVLYHEARRRGQPMTRLANQLLESALAGSEGWQEAKQAMRLQDASVDYRADPQPSTGVCQRPANAPAV